MEPTIFETAIALAGDLFTMVESHPAIYVPAVAVVLIGVMKAVISAIKGKGK